MRVSTDRGREFEDHVADMLTVRRWGIIDRNVTVDDAEIDIIADAPNGVRWYIECKGGEGGKSGLARMDTVKRTVGTAWALRRSNTLRTGVYFVVTSAMPRPGSRAHRLVVDAINSGLIAGAGTVSALLTLHDMTTGVLPESGVVRQLSMEW